MAAIADSDPEVTSALESTLRRLTGVALQEIRLPDPALMFETSNAILLSEAFALHREALAGSPEMFSEALRSRGLRITRLARGVPVGSELEYVDLGTIAHALVDRR